ncbi:hypothetical protein FC19_GL000906 [Liquorilactobacillus aquaticus DSM 21051]|uniref:Nucleic acid-binding protein n=1 Tax=Liquorilactobacillus aquaticus DSM 21051 TaxID=1423725 RepID=A0A0R2CY47_9LACO|nr:YceD family protein [Liquorilactobacillus aquaticus]KRM96608.1 hypothetical protein FC19_GL000906 [Liquorilactobacillus aquaticus DSM 21051]
MKWSLSELSQKGAKPLHIDTMVDVTASIKKRNKDILAISLAHVNGLFSMDSLGLLGYLEVAVTVTVPSTRSLKPVEIPLKFNTSEYYVSHHESNMERFGSNDVVIILDNDVIDLDQIVEDNVLLQIPMKILTAEEKQQTAEFRGVDWNLSEEDHKRNDDDHIDPRMAKLKDFFKTDK